MWTEPFLSDPKGAVQGRVPFSDDRQAIDFAEGRQVSAN